MGGTLLVSGTDNGREFFIGLLKDVAFLPVTAAASGDEARRLLPENDFALVLLNAPIRGGGAAELAVHAAQTSSAAVLLVVGAELADEAAARTEEDGVLVLPKPFSRPLFHQTLRLAMAARRRMLGLRDENIQLQQKIEEIRLVDRAKCALIQYLNLTEAQAHRYIEKQAMDTRQTRREVACRILQTYGA